MMVIKNRGCRWMSATLEVFGHWASQFYPVMVNLSTVCEGVLYFWNLNIQCYTGSHCEWVVFLTYTTILFSVYCAMFKTHHCCCFLPKTGWWGFNLQIFKCQRIVFVLLRFYCIKLKSEEFVQCIRACASECFWITAQFPQDVVQSTIPIVHRPIIRHNHHTLASSCSRPCLVWWHSPAHVMADVLRSCTIS